MRKDLRVANALASAEIHRTGVLDSGPKSSAVRAILTDANLTDAEFTNEFSGDAALTDVSFAGANLVGAWWPRDAPVPEGWKLASIFRDCDVAA
jgi:uncharacterized protein YjbI with pentapeptide repeats